VEKLHLRASATIFLTAAAVGGAGKLTSTYGLTKNARHEFEGREIDGPSVQA